MKDKRRLLYFSNVNWKWIKQRPHFIPYYMSKKNIYVEFISINSLFKTKATRNVLGGLNINECYVIPLSSRFKCVENINTWLIKKKISRMKYDFIILTHPNHYLYIPEKYFEESKIIYECMDNIPYFYKGELRKNCIRREYETIKRVDQVVVSSNYLKQALTTRYPDYDVPIDVVFNSLDKDSFCKQPTKIKLNSPNLVYIGTIDEWLDIRLLNDFAANHPEYTIYLIGPLVKKIEQCRDNIIFLGSIDHSQVLDYICSSDIMIMPFLVNELTKAVDPVKIYEYIGMNKPVLCSHWGELDKFSEFVYFYETLKEFEKQISVISKEPRDNRGKNDDFIEENNWGNRVDQFLDVILGKSPCKY